MKIHRNKEKDDHMGYISIHLIGTLIFDTIILIIALSNIWEYKRLESFSRLNNRPFISVLVPARNEEENIERCITSLINQDYPNYEIIVLNDNSTDRTGQILERLGAENDKLKVINGKELPKGWMGKNWACHQLSEVAKGEYLLFTDADTKHRPETISDSIFAMIHFDADLLNAFPRQITGTFGEKLIVPITHWSFFSFLPLFVAHRIKSTVLTLTIGQFMLFKREAYSDIGGHAAVKGSVLDDVPLGRNIKKFGLKWRLVDGMNRISCRMYTDFKSSFNGFARNLLAAFNYNTILLFWVWFWIVNVIWDPIIFLTINLFTNFMLFYEIILSLMLIIMNLILWAIAYIRFDYPIYLIFLQPIISILMFAIALKSLYQQMRGSLVWKDRKM
ncbi:MAG: glycosyltransferase [Candidatus Lokiarchaeota archaeon]|nr:glycosyltransferase [Candidatus Lokiarchaeota archaeon]